MTNQPETPEERFERIAATRSGNAIKAIELLCNLTGSGYESTPQRRAEIWNVINDHMATLAVIWGLPSGVAKSCEEAAVANVADRVAEPEPETGAPETMPRDRLDFSIACAKVDRALKEIERTREGLEKMLAIAEAGKR